jgi:hypothetical protein
MTMRQPTGASNLEYDLIATMHKLLEGNAALEQYIEDARQAGDTEVEDCFRRIHNHNHQNIAALRSMLAKRFAQG